MSTSLSGQINEQKKLSDKEIEKFDKNYDLFSQMLVEGGLTPYTSIEKMILSRYQVWEKVRGVFPIDDEMALKKCHELFSIPNI